jgi:hypothetical protein
MAKKDGVPSEKETVIADFGFYICTILPFLANFKRTTDGR